MFEKGTMIPVKKILGILLAIVVLNYIYPISQIQNILTNYPYLIYILIGISSFFLIRSGWQLD